MTAVSSVAGNYNTSDVTGSVGGGTDSIAIRSPGGKHALFWLPAALPEGTVQDCAISETDLGGGNTQGLVCSTVRTGVYISAFVEGGIWYWDMRQTRWIRIFKSTTILPGRLALFPNDTLLVTTVNGSSPDFGAGAVAAPGIYMTQLSRRR